MVGCEEVVWLEEMCLQLVGLGCEDEMVGDYGEFVEDEDV